MSTTRFFKNPVQVIDNIVAVTSYLAEIIKENGGDPKRETLTLIPATDGKMYHKEPDGSIFRAYLFHCRRNLLSTD